MQCINCTKNFIETAKLQFWFGKLFWGQQIKLQGDVELGSLIKFALTKKKSVNTLATNIVNTPTELAGTFSLHFSTVGKNLVAKIPNENIAPESYFECIRNTDFPYKYPQPT